MTRTDAQTANMARQQEAQVRMKAAEADRSAAWMANDEAAWNAAQDRWQAACADWQAATKEGAETKWQ